MKTVISQEQMISLLQQACPSYVPDSDPDYADLIYLALGDLARHLLKLHQQGRTEELGNVARVIERLHLEGDPFVREAATIGLLEGIQNNWGHAGVDPELFASYLLPESAKWW